MEFTDKQNGSLVSVCSSAIPAYLRSGEFFRSLHGGHPDEAFQVPANALKPSPTVTSLTDLMHVFTSLRFWVVSVPIHEAVEFILANIETCRPTVDQFAADFPYLRVFQDIPDDTNGSYMDKAIAFGGLALVKQLHSLGQQFTPDSHMLLARAGNLEMLMFARQNGVVCSNYTFQEAVIRGHLNIVTYLHNEQVAAAHTAPYACMAAAREGHLDVLEFLHTHGYDWGTSCIMYAAAGGHRECLRYLHEKGCKWDEFAFTEAASNGHLPVLQYLHNHNAPFDSNAINNAAGNGHLECLIYLHEVGHSWGEITTYIAAMNGRNLVLSYLLEHNCPYNTNALNAALQNNHTECVNLFCAKGIDRSTEALDAALLNNNVHLVKYVGTRWGPETYLRAVELGCSVHVLTALYELDCEMDDTVMKRLIEVGLVTVEE